jgi:Protein of unknown function (DUF3237)
MVDSTSSPQLEFTLELRVNIGPTLELGQASFGTRRNVPITGGTFSGPHVAGRILPGGADSQLVETDGVTFVDAQYVIETEDGIRIGVRNQGIRHGSKEILARLAAGVAVPSSQYYFRTSPRFYPPVSPYNWLKKSIFLGIAERHAELIIVRVWKVT